MLTTKTFLKKTRQGKVIKVVREHYLRDDIPCGSQGCQTECKELYESELHQERCNQVVLLSANPTSKTGLLDFDHYVIIDTNVALEEIDLLEDANGLENVVLLQVRVQPLTNHPFAKKAIQAKAAR